MKNLAKFHFLEEVHSKKFAEYLPDAILFNEEQESAKLFKGVNITTLKF